MKKFNKVLSVAVASAMVMAMAGCTARCRDCSRRDQRSRRYQRLSGRIQIPG